MVASTCISFSTGRKTAAQSSQHSLPDGLEKYNKLVIEHQDAVFQQAYWILGDDRAAEDATQEAFLRAFRNFDTYQGSTFRPWIMKIVTNYCLDQLRRQKIRPTIPLDAFNEYNEEMEDPSWLRDPGASVEELVMQAELRGKIKQCVNRLPPDYRTAIILVDFQAFDYREAAAAAGVSMGTFKSRLWRARMQLQKWLSADTLPLAQ